MTKNPETQRSKCPSYNAVVGATLIGVIDASGRVGYVNPGMPVDERFLDLASNGRAAEERFRFADQCARSKCQYWVHSNCQVVELALSTTESKNVDEQGSLPHCAIRSDCQWFKQRGQDACRVCPSIFNYHPGGDELSTGSRASQP